MQVPEFPRFGGERHQHRLLRQQFELLLIHHLAPVPIGQRPQRHLHLTPGVAIVGQAGLDEQMVPEKRVLRRAADIGEHRMEVDDEQLR